jgi:hypothetical protein
MMFLFDPDPDRIGLLGKPPAEEHSFPPRASSHTRYPTFHARKCQYEAIRVWSYTTFNSCRSRSWDNLRVCSAQTRTGIGHLRKPPGVELIPCHRKPLRHTRTLHDPAQTQVWSEQVGLDTTFISQGSRSWGKLAVETWRVKTELIIITILHIKVRRKS